MALLLSTLLLATAPPLDLRALDAQVAAQRALHGRLDALPWTGRALRAALPARCQEQTREEAMRLPVDEPLEGASSRARYGAPGGATVEVLLVDLAGLPRDEAVRRIDSLSEEARSLSMDEAGRVPVRTRRLQALRQGGRSAGFSRFNADQGASALRLVVGGRFLIALDGEGQAGPKLARACLRAMDWPELLRSARAKRRR